MTNYNAFKFIGVSLIPVFVATSFHLIFKHADKKIKAKDPNTLPKILRTEKSRYWTKQIIIGIILGALSIGSFYLGSDVRDFLNPVGVNPGVLVVGTSSFYPVIAGFIFGAPAALISSLIAAIFRCCIPGMLRWPTVIACILGGASIAFATHYIFKDKRPKWYFAFLGGLFVEAINLILLYLFNLDNISAAFKTIKQFDLLCMFCNGGAAALTSLIIALFERESIIKVIYKDNRIANRLQLGLLAVCIVALFATTTSTYTVTYADGFNTFQDIAFNNVFDVHKDFSTMMTRTSYLNAPNRHLVTAEGFCIILTSEENQEVPYIDDEGKQKTIIYPNKYTVVAIPEALPKYLHDKNPIGKVFAFSDHKHLSDYQKYECKVYDEGFSKGTYNTFFQTPLVYSGDEERECMVSFSKVVNSGVEEIGGQILPYEDTYYSVVLIPKEEVVASSNISFRVVLFVDIIVFIALFAVVNLLISRRIIANIKTMDTSLEKIMDGDLSEELKLKGSYKEFDTLSTNINLAVGALKNYGEEIERKVTQELEYAKKIQANSLPTVFPNEATYNISALMNTAKEVGGDFYDCFKMNNGRVMFLIADVSGKGIPAAMFMMRARTLIKSLTLTDASLEEIANTTNNLLIDDNEAGMFVTAWLGILDPATGECNYINAGHCDPLLKRNGIYSLFKNKHQLVLAGIRDTKYESEKIYLQAGDELLLYTDGVTEATDRNYNQFGVDRLIDYVNDTTYFNAKQLLTAVSDEVARFEGYADQFDDITMLSLRYIGVTVTRPENILNIKARPHNASIAINYVESILTREGLNINPKYIPQMSIVVDELFANVAYHAYPKGVVGELSIEVDIRDDVLYLTFVDSGIPFDPTLPFKADTTSGVNERKQGGLGIFLVKRAVDKLTYERKNNMNYLYIEKNLKPKEEEKKMEEAK